MSNYSHEIVRKTIHLSSFWIPLLYFFIQRQPMILILGVVTCCVVFLDCLRISVPLIRHCLHRIFGSLMRVHELEKKSLCGASYFMIGSWLTIFFYPKEIAITAIMVLIVSDSAASLIGKRYGRHALLTKSVEGTLAFMVSGWMVIVGCGVVFHETPSFYIAAVVAVIVGSFVELISKDWHLDDNTTIPVTVGGIMMLARMAIHFVKLINKN